MNKHERCLLPLLLARACPQSFFSTMSGHKNRFDVVIIGAGVAGLRSACLLGEAGYSVRVCEARQRVGGRTFSVAPASSCDDNERVDFGGQWLGPTQLRALRLCEKYDIELFDQYNSQESLLRVDNFLFRYSGTIPSLPWFYLLSLQVSCIYVFLYVWCVVFVVWWRSCTPVFTDASLADCNLALRCVVAPFAVICSMEND
jgi:hypothetical protein